MSLDGITPVYLPDPLERHHPLNRGRVAWWLTLPGLDGGRKWYNLVGTLHGTLTGMSTSAVGWRHTPRPGGYGALAFNGTTDSVAVPDSPPLRLTRWTIGMWIRGDSASGATDLVALGKGSGAAQGDFNYLFCYSHSNSAFARAWSFNDGATWYNAKYTTVPAANTWYRLVCTYDGAGLKAYLNGRLETTTVTSATPVTGSNFGLSVGANSAGLQWFPGQIDDVTLSSLPWSAEEVRADYELSQRGYPGVLRRVPPVVYFVVAHTRASVATTLSGVTVSVAVSVADTASATSTLAGVAGSASTTVTDKAIASATLSGVTVSSNATASNTASSSIILGEVAVTATALVVVTATNTVTLDRVVSTSIVYKTILVNSSTVLDGVVVEVIGTSVVTASVSFILEGVAVSSTPVIAHPPVVADYVDFLITPTDQLDFLEGR